MQRSVFIGAGLLLVLGAAYADPAATVLFTQPGAQIVDTAGRARPAKQGDVLQMGEQLQTPPGGISQLRMTDGSLLGVRPDSQVKIELPVQASDRAQRVVSLTQGSVRVLGAELMDAKKSSNITLKTGEAVYRLKGADLETVPVKPAGSGSGAGGRGAADGRPAAEPPKLLAGSGTVTGARGDATPMATVRPPQGGAMTPRPGGDGPRGGDRQSDRNPPRAPMAGPDAGRPVAMPPPPPPPPPPPLIQPVTIQPVLCFVSETGEKICR